MAHDEKELAEFIRPNKKRAGEVRTPGGKQTERLYDPTAVNANRKLANFLNGASTGTFICLNWALMLLLAGSVLSGAAAAARAADVAARTWRQACSTPWP